LPRLDSVAAYRRRSLWAAAVERETVDDADGFENRGNARRYCSFLVQSMSCQFWGIAIEGDVLFHPPA